MIILPGDILFTRSRSRLGKIIRFCTRNRGEEKTKASHVGIFTRPGDRYTAMLVEAQSQCNRHPFGSAYPSQDESPDLCIFRPINLSESDLQAIVDKASSYVGRDYGYFKLILHLLDWSLGGIYLFRRIGRIDNYPICSYVVASAYKAAKKDFGVSTYAASPDDIWDFCLANPDKYHFLWQRGDMLSTNQVMEYQNV